MMMIAPVAEMAEVDALALCTLLEEMIVASRKLMTLLQDEKRHIIEGNIDAVVHLNIEKEAALEHLARLNQDRITAVQTDKNNQPPTLENLIPLCPEIYQHRLKLAQTRLEALNTGISELNQMNGLLTERVLQQISGLLGVLTGLSPSGSTYARSGIIQHQMPSVGRTFGKG